MHMGSFRSSRRFAQAALPLALVALLAACGGGGGGSSATPPTNPTSAPTSAVTPTPTPTYPPTTTGTIAAGASPQTGSLAAAGTGVTSSVTVPAVTSGSASIALTLSTTLPANVPSVASVKRIPATIGVSILSAIAYVQFTPTATITLPTSPAFTFTLAPGSTLPSGASTYIGFYDPAAATWVNLDGPGVAGTGGTYTFAANPVSMTFKAGVTYVFGWYSTAAVVPPLPSPSPSPSPTPVATPSSSGSAAPLSGPTYSPTQSVPLNQSWGPNDVANALQFPVQHGYNGSGTTIAIVIDSAVNMSDINTFLSYYQIPTTSRTISSIVLNGASSTPGADQDEASLDVETVASLAPGANVLLVIVPDLTTTSLNNAFNRIFENNLAQVVSLSASGCEAGSDASQESPIFLEGANKGIAFLTASGDTGNECYVDTVDTVPVFKVGVGYPASDPNVIAVGGNETANASGPTSLTSNVVWNDSLTSDHSQEASGGGISTVFTPPPFQTGLSGASQSGRNVPDVAMPAADTAIYLNGSWELVNGTSWASPEFAAMLAEVYQYCNVPSSGNTAPAALPYAAYASAASAFVDVTSGNNQYKTSTPFYTATAGYDAASGLGVPLGMPMAQALCPNHTLSSRARGTLSIAQASHRAAEAYQIDETPSVRGLVDQGRRPASATTAIQLVLLPGSSASDEAAVTAVLQNAGLTITQTFSNHLLVDASGPSSAVEQVFGTQLHDVTQGQYGTRYLPAGPATIPASLAPYLSGVVLDNVVIAHAGPLHRH